MKTLITVFLAGIILIGGLMAYYSQAEDKSAPDKKAEVTPAVAKMPSTDQLIKQADVLLEKLEKTKKDKTLNSECQKEMMSLAYQIIQSAQKMTIQCNDSLKEKQPDIGKAIDLNTQSNSLLNKSLELLSRSCPILSADKKETAPKDQYTCPMHPEVISDKPGKCPKCGMNLEKKKQD
jgi:hypothetical protein